MMSKSILAVLVLGLATSQLAAGRAARTKLDFNGDGKSDLAIFEPATEMWHAMSVDRSYLRSRKLGTKSSILVPAAYGGSVTEMGAYEPNTGVWSTRSMQQLLWTKTAQFGYSATFPVAGHFDADNIADLAVYEDGKWYINRSRGGFISIGFGFKGAYPLAADFDGDGIDEIVVVWDDLKKGSMQWGVYSLGTKGSYVFSFGPNGAIPIPGRYLGDAAYNPAVYDASSKGGGTFFISNGQAGDAKPIVLTMGGSADTPIGGCDFDGDNKHDIALYNQNTGIWQIGLSQSGTGVTIEFGYNGTIPAGISYYKSTGRHQEITEPRSAGVVDGIGGFLWKSHAEQNGKLLVLWPTKLFPRSTISKVVVASDPAGENVLDTLVDHGVYTTGRHKFRSHKYLGSHFGNGIYAVAIFKNGDLPKPYLIPTGANRWD